MDSFGVLLVSKPKSSYEIRLLSKYRLKEEQRTSWAERNRIWDEEYLRYRELGYSTEEIARMFGVTPDAITLRARRHGLT